VAQERPTASGVSLTGLDGGILDAGTTRLTRAQARDLRRSAPLTHAKLEKHFRCLGASEQRASDLQVGSEHGHAHRAEAVPADVVAIVRRAGELGFSTSRVAVALDVVPSALASFELAAPFAMRGPKDDQPGGPDSHR